MANASTHTSPRRLGNEMSSYGSYNNYASQQHHSSPQYSQGLRPAPARRQPTSGYQDASRQNGRPQYQAQSQSYNSHNYKNPHYTMSGGDYQRPRLGATFYPSGNDDYYMPPEVISPLPQRVMPEVPENMQQGLANLELEARREDARSGSMSTSSYSNNGYAPPLQQQHAAADRGYTANYEHTNASAYQNVNKGHKLQPGYNNDRGLESPRFTPFPKLQNPGPNVPPSDDEKEDILDRARQEVLSSNDPEMQLAWAQDALNWCEVAAQNAARADSGPRSVTPKIEHQLREDAISIVNFLAEQTHPKADFIKAMWLEFGKFGMRLDKKEAFLGYRRAASKGYARAEYRIGMQYESSNEPQKAIKHYMRGVELKDSAANYRLGMMTLLGQHGQRQDARLAIERIRFAADTADENAPQGAYIFGMLLARELPKIDVPEHILPMNTNDAKMYIEKAAYLGFAKAQAKMGQAYELCQLGCDFNPALSLHYNALASRQGEPDADMAISKWFLCGYEGIFEKNEELAFTYAQRAAQTQMATAEFAMGYFYEIGMYVPSDLVVARSWYQKAMEHGNKDAQGRIDALSLNRTLSKKDHEQVAISRIKSQYGSQRGGRPPRFQQSEAPPMPVMMENSTPMPDPSTRHSTAPPNRQGLNPNGGPPQRPKSAAPYPHDDSPSRNNPQSSQFQSAHYNPNIRPTSAFSGATQQSDRPNSNSAFMIKPGPPQHANTLPPRPQTNLMSPGWEPQSQGRPQSQQPGGPRQNNPPERAPTLPNLDFGPSLGGGPPPPQKSPAPNRGPAASSGSPYPSMPSRKPVGPGGAGNGPAAGQQQQQRRDPTPSGQQRRGSAQPPSMSGGLNGPGTPGPGRDQNGRAMSSSASVASVNTTNTTSSSNTMTSTQSAQALQQKKGPATFEAMGIPKTKDESECIVM